MTRDHEPPRSTGPANDSAGDSPVEVYLDELLGRLHGRPRAVRRALAEVDDHLHEAVAAHVAAGVDEDAAARRAVAEFGDVATVAAGFNRADAASLPQLVADTVGQLVPVAAIGLVAIGVSGVVEQLMTWGWGRVFVFADAPGSRYSASECRYWQHLHPGARTCTQAFLAEANADGVQFRLAFGLLGLALLVAGVFWRRRRGLTGLLSSGSKPIPLFAGTVAFGIAAIGLVGSGFDRMRVSQGNGAGQWFSAGIVAVPIAVSYAVLFVRRARRSGLPDW